MLRPRCTFTNEDSCLNNMGPYPTRNGPPTRSCHNCRRRRWRCDRSVPMCNKCHQAGQICLGYDKLFLWTNGVASRGKMMGKTFAATSPPEKPLVPRCADQVSHSKDLKVRYKKGPRLAQNPYWYRQLGDPVFQGLSRSAKFYLCYYDRQVCKDLVLQDLPTRNPFRDLLSLAGEFKVILHIIVANSALHLANASQIIARVKSAKLSPGVKKSILQREELHGASLEAYRDALLAKQKALHALSRAVTEQDSMNVDIVLASILLFIKFELLDSGKTDWRFHVDGARQLIGYLSQSGKTGSITPSGLRNCIISNCATYTVLGTTLNNPNPTEPPTLDSFDLASISLEDQVNTCLSCPPILLQLIRDASHHLQVAPCNNDDNDNDIQQLPLPPTHQTAHLLSLATAFRPSTWARSLQPVSTSSTFSLEARTHIATAYQAAVKIYLYRSTSPSPAAHAHTLPLETFVTQILTHLSPILPHSPSFKATCWPTLIAGAETDDPANRAWVMERFEAGLEELPWGYLVSAVEILQLVWARKEERDGLGGGDWIGDLRGLGRDWLIA